MDWSNILTVGLSFVVGNISAGVIINELLKHRLESQRSREDRQAALQLDLLLALQRALEQLNQGRVKWGATKLAVSDVTKKWPKQLPPPDLESLGEQGDAAIRALLPAVRDCEVKEKTKQFQKHARVAFDGANFAETRAAVEAARAAHEEANDRIGVVVQTL